MKVSIITAFYHGNAYMEQYVATIRANQLNMDAGDELEAIIVNDSPDEAVQLPLDGSSCNIWVINQSQNGGTHSARVRGLQESKGEYVMFLDQDDLLAEDAIAKHVAKVKNWQSQMREANARSSMASGTYFEQLILHPVSVSNAQLEQKDGSKVLWYRSTYHKHKVADYKTYLKVGVQIISPGQCLVPRKMIPPVWQTKICKTSGADDYYLWLLLLADCVPFTVLDEPLYLHKFTGENLSSDTKKMDDSTFEFVEYLKEGSVVSDKDIATLERMVKYKGEFRDGGVLKKLTSTCRNLDIFLANVIFKLRSKTPYGFNR